MKVEIKKLDYFGRGIAYVDDKICFIENALPKEIVDIEIVKKKKTYCEGKVTNYYKTSDKRIKNNCPYYEKCGGCQLRHLDYNEENKWKEEKVKELLFHIGGVNPKVNTIIFRDDKNYRNKVVLHYSKKGYGYYEKNSKNIIPIKECLLLDERINNEVCNISSTNKEVIIRVSNDGKELLTNYKSSITTNIGDKRYIVDIDSFFQVNKFVTKDLFDLIRKAIKKNYHTCLDLYCGTGSIGIYISDLVDQVIGIDSNPSNIIDANKNLELNSISNIKFVCDKVENKIDEFKNIDLIIVDPPRAGLDEKTRIYIKEINPEKIIYVSCDPATLARDLKDLNTNYKILEITPVNMFPRTYHCESITVLERK